MADKVDYTRNPLTHIDVRNVKFNAQRKDGYNEREVAAFLENVAESLYGLHWQNGELLEQRDSMAKAVQDLTAENERLKAEIAQLSSAQPAVEPAPAAVPGSGWGTDPAETALMPRISDNETAEAVAPVAVEPVATPEPVAVAEPAVSMDSVVRTLELAQKTADALVSEARVAADSIVADAQARAAGLVADAEREQADLLARTEVARDVAVTARQEAADALRQIIADTETALTRVAGE